MEKEIRWLVGIDWAMNRHQACLMDAQGVVLDNASFEHGGAGFQEMAEWIWSGCGAPDELVEVAIEVPHGPVVEAMLSFGFAVHSINPKQLDRFRDRFWPAGAKDDRRDAEVLASALRTDPQAFRAVHPPGPEVLKLRGLSRAAYELSGETVRLTNRIRQHLWSYYPQLLQVVGNDLSHAWVRELWKRAPTPEAAARLRVDTLRKLLTHHRIRRLSAEQLQAALRQPSMPVRPDTVEAAIMRIEIDVERLALVKQQQAGVRKQIEALLKSFDLNRQPQSDSSGSSVPRRDCEILRSMPGIGPGVLSILLGEAGDAIEERDLKALRCLCGVAPVTVSSGKSSRVIRRRASHPRLV